MVIYRKTHRWTEGNSLSQGQIRVNSECEPAVIRRASKQRQGEGEEQSLAQRCPDYSGSAWCDVGSVMNLFPPCCWQNLNDRTGQTLLLMLPAALIWFICLQREKRYFRLLMLVLGGSVGDSGKEGSCMTHQNDIIFGINVQKSLVPTFKLLHLSLKTQKLLDCL